MKSNPSSKPACEEASKILYRLFNQYFFPQDQFGNLKLFVCEFIESSNGTAFVDCIRAFECDFNVPGKFDKGLEGE